MPRRARRESATGFYHIVSRGLNRENIFGEKREKTRFLNLLKDNLNECNVEIYAYCVMSNHFHLLVKVEKEIMPIFMAKVLGRYAKYYNYKHNRTGYVFENRYNTQCIEDERYFWSCLRYIHMNPVKAKICSNIMQYEHSSMREYTGKRKNREILCEKALKLYEEKFKDGTSIGTFYREKDENVFLGTEEEEYRQYVELAWEILWNMQEQRQLQGLEILQFAESRVQFENAVKEKLGVSKSYVKRIRKQIEGELYTIQKGTG